MFLVRRPTPSEIARFLERSAALPLSYQPIGLADRPIAGLPAVSRSAKAGFSLDELTTVVGRGRETFDRASRALERWAHFDLGWVELFPRESPLATGTVVCVLVRHLGFWSLNGCRIVYPLGSGGSGEFGFAYGTLTNHAECGEEIFRVTLDPDTSDVTYTIRAASRPRALLAALGYPVTRRLQARFRRESAAAMTRASRP
jgi:uncharacterized protein (UPF0548 family)